MEKLLFSSEDSLNFPVPVTEEELLSCIRSLSTPLSYLFDVLRGKNYSSLPAVSLCQVSQYQAGQQHCLAAHLICNHKRKWLLTGDLAGKHSNSKAHEADWRSYNPRFHFDSPWYQQESWWDDILYIFFLMKPSLPWQRLLLSVSE